MHKVQSVRPLPRTCELELVFESGEKRVFDVSPYLDKGIFTQLRADEYYNKVTVFLDSVAWPNGQDFDPDHLYIESRPAAGPVAGVRGRA